MEQQIQYSKEVYRSHNGKITIENPETGGHRTFEIRTQSEDSRFAPGKRVVSLMTGTDNESDYTGFGFAETEGVYVWRKKQGGVWDTFAKMLAQPEQWMERGLVYHFEGHCRKCNRTLTNPDSIKSGIGPVCAQKGM